MSTLSTRKFGIVSDVTGLKTGLVANSLSFSYGAETAEARNEEGKVIDLAVYSQNETVSINGLYTGDGLKPGTVVQIGEKNYLITSTGKNETNTGFVEASAEARTVDDTGVLWAADGTQHPVIPTE